MIALLANRWNPAATSLALRWAGSGIRLLTPADLCIAGWVQHLDDPHAGTAILAGQPIPQRDLTAVLPLMPSITPDDLPTIVPQDRPYVAAEMSAFLVSWLTRLPCLVLNRPTPPCLAGPFWRPERWTHLAAQSHIPVQPLHRRAIPNQPPPPDPAEDPTRITVIGLHTFSEAHPALHRHALTLARAARVDLLEVQFSTPEPNALLLAAHTFPDLASPAHADATLALLQAGPQG